MSQDWGLSERQMSALRDICDTLCPTEDGLPSARELGVPEALVRAVALNPRAAERRQLALLLSLWDTRVLGALGGAGLKRFSSLPRPERERVLQAWADSGSPQRRAAFQALRKGALLFYYMLPGQNGSSNAAWEAIGYPGPLGRNDQAPPRPLAPLEPAQDTSLECDVVVVGSGAGGGPVAGVLSEAGLDVVVVETGGYYDDADFDGSELTALTGFYAGAPSASKDESIGLVAGSCLGGGTVVNYTTSFRTPGPIREEWASHGVPAFTGPEFDASLDAVAERLGTSQEYNDPGARDQILQQAAEKLGWSSGAQPRNVRGCAQGRECGYCGLGCRVGAKMSTAKTWLLDAHQRGTRLIVRTRVDRVLIEGGAARGIEGRTASGHRLTVRSRAVVAACGAIQTPALLRRSGLQNPNIGRNLKVHPVAAVMGVFDSALDPWEGVMQARYVDEHANLNEGYGVLYETGPLHPHLFLPFSPWRGSRAHFGLMEAMRHTVPVGVVLRDRQGGRVQVGRDGEPVVHYALSEFDRAHLRRGVEGAAEMLEAAGAQRIFSSHARWVAYEPGRTGDRARFMADGDACGYGAGQIQLLGFHLQGSARMGGSPASAACDPMGQTWDVRNLYVCDGSAFPTAVGVNPHLSIQSVAHMNARALAARLS
jgi:choline dehydrogenase-like flavoprotein